jgi:hypothetical protein
MKQIYLILMCIPLCIIFLPGVSFAQTAQLGTYFTCDIPDHSIMPKMSTNAGLGLQLAVKPIPRTPIMLELKASIGLYSNRTLQQTYYFDSISSTTTNVTYSSAMNRVSLGTKIHLVNEFRAFRPYITPQIGAAFMRSRIVIDDPEDQDDCKPLERKTTQRYNGFTYGAEAGLEVSMDRLFKGVQSENKHRLYASVTFMNSFRTFEYVNVKYMQDHDHAAMTGGSSSGTTTEDGRDLNTTFINVSTNSLHEHKIAELYRTQLRFWGFNIGYVYNF